LYKRHRFVAVGRPRIKSGNNYEKMDIITGLSQFFLRKMLGTQHGPVGTQCL